MGDLVELFPKEQSLEKESAGSADERSCFDCQYALFGQSGTFCRLYAIDVINEEEEAQVCEDYTA